jgi:hypothetical protein
MLDHKVESRDHWSYCDEYLKNRKIAKAREIHPELDQVFLTHVESGTIPRAMEVRTKLAVICGGNAKNLKRYVQGQTSFEDAFETAVIAGEDNVSLAKLRRFRMWLALNETEDDMKEASKSVRDRMRFELKEIERRAGKLKTVLEAKTG